MNMIKSTPPTHWICEEKRVSPLTKDDCIPAITATYQYVSFANIWTTAHFPRAAVIEIGKYVKEEWNDNWREKDGQYAGERSD